MLTVELRDRVEDPFFRLRAEAVVEDIGRPITMRWQEPPGQRYDRILLLQLHVGELVQLPTPLWSPDDWEGREADRQRLLAASPSVSDLSRVIPVQDPDTDDVTLAITWCVGGRFRSEGPVLEYAIGVVGLTGAQRRRLFWWEGPRPRHIRFPPLT